MLTKHRSNDRAHLITNNLYSLQKKKHRYSVENRNDFDRGNIISDELTDVAKAEGCYWPFREILRGECIVAKVDYPAKKIIIGPRSIRSR